MFHVEQYLLPLSSVVLVAAAEVPPAPPLLQLALATDSEEARNEVQAGLVDLLLGWEESARIRFERAARADDMCSLAWCGLMMTEADPAARKRSMQELTDRINQLPATPPETFYLATFFRLLANDHLGAAEDFIQRAERYRHDVFAACWGVLLLHCADVGYDDLGKSLPHQSRALELASKLYQDNPENPLVCFVRAYVEEAAPAVSEQALAAAENAVKHMPTHPIPQHLYGHLLYRSGRAAEAVPHFMEAVKSATRKDIPEWESGVLMTSRLYVSTAMWTAGQSAKALATRRAMNKMPLDREHLHAPAVILRRWEAATLPLRVLVADKKVPSIGQISAASAAAEVKPPLPGDDPVLLVRDCLRACLYVRVRAKNKDVRNAAKSLAIAEEALKQFEQTRDDVLECGVHYITPWTRALEACQIALSMARAEVYTRTSDMWKESARQAVRPVTLMLPPVIPVARADKPEQKVSSGEESKKKGSRDKVSPKKPEASKTNAAKANQTVKPQPKKQRRASRPTKKTPPPAPPVEKKKKSWFGRLFD